MNKKPGSPPEATDFSPTYFDQMAALEDHHPWTRAMRELTIGLIRGHLSQPLDRALDAGCGTGRFLCDLKDAVRVPVGADLFHVAVARAKQRCSAEWLTASAADLPFRKGSFDLIHSADVLQHMSLEDTDRALDDFADLLKPGGLLALRVRSPKLLSNSEDVDFSHSFRPSRLRTALQSRGFEILFLSRVNALPSLAAELRPTHQQKSGTVVGIKVSAKSRPLEFYLKCERWWLLHSRLPMPFGHTSVCLARKR